MGVVALLSGQPKEGVSIEARADSEGFYEETVTDSSGNYRLRGLLPDTTYVIRVSRKVEYGSHHIERASPEYMTIKVGFCTSFPCSFKSEDLQLRTHAIINNYCYLSLFPWASVISWPCFLDYRLDLRIIGG